MILDKFSLKGKVALITGGASGYGLQCAKAMVEAGAIVYLASRNIDKLRGVAELLGAKAIKYDQSNLDDPPRLVKNILKDHDHIDILINNAVSRPMKKGWGDSYDCFDESMKTNATGLFVLTRAVGEVMIKNKSGSIINIGSIMGMIGVEPNNYDEGVHGWYPDYFFHKGGMINFTRFCASYFGPHGVRVNCISPGGLYNPKMSESFVKNYSDRTQLGRLANDSDLMGAVVFLASNTSEYITGVNLPVDGGYTAK